MVDHLRRWDIHPLGDESRSATALTEYAKHGSFDRSNVIETPSYSGAH